MFIYNNTQYASGQEVVFAKFLDCLFLEYKAHPAGKLKLPDFAVYLKDSLFDEIEGVYIEIKGTNREYIGANNEDDKHKRWCLKHNRVLIVLELPKISDLNTWTRIKYALKKPAKIFTPQEGEMPLINESPIDSFLSENAQVDLNREFYEILFRQIHSTTNV